MEILSHPLPLLLSKKDLGDGTILPGEWRLKQDLDSSKSLLEPMPQIFIFRHVHLSLLYNYVDIEN